MEAGAQINKVRKKKNVLLTVLIIFIILMLFSASAFAAMTLKNDKVYKGVHIGTLDVSGMDRKEMSKLLDEVYNTAVTEKSVTLKSPDAELSEIFSKFDVKYDTQKAINEAYSIGRSGNIFKRLYDIAKAGISGIKIDVAQTYDEGKIESFVNRFSVQVFKSVKESALLITDSEVKLRSGRHGEHIDKAATINLVKNVINSGKSSIITPEIIITKPTKSFNADELYNQIISEAKEASYTMENSKLVLKPHSVGRTVDKKKLEEIINELEKTEDTERLLPVSTVLPSITSEAAESMLFRDELASAKTSFGTGTQNGKNRKHNMEISVAKIDNLVLLPGEEFSFNRVVGPRDVAHGYKTAHVYIRGRIEDGIGGGICQVSTTIYNAVLKADLQVTERKNHSFTVGYVPLGQDATAYYGGTDFRFVNSTNWPIKLRSYVKGNSIYFSILGTNENPKKSVIISNKILSETPFTVQTTVDPTLPPGTTKELQEGLNGYVVETFKTIKEDGKVISQTKLHTSRYNPCTQILLVGPAPVEENTVPGPDNNTPPADNNTTPGETTPPTDSNNEPAADEIIPPSNEDTTPQIPGNTAEPSVEEMPEGQEIID
jgi:vancomycin resistance protein YoaR